MLKTHKYRQQAVDLCHRWFEEENHKNLYEIIDKLIRFIKVI